MKDTQTERVHYSKRGHYGSEWALPAGLFSLAQQIVDQRQLTRVDELEVGRDYAVFFVPPLTKQAIIHRSAMEHAPNVVSVVGAIKIVSVGVPRADLFWFEGRETIYASEIDEKVHIAPLARFGLCHYSSDNNAPSVPLKAAGKWSTLNCLVRPKDLNEQEKRIYLNIERQIR